MVQTTKQITVFLENKPGRLANLLAHLAQAKINITALAVMDRSDQGVLRLVAEDPGRTGQVLKELNLPHTETDVLKVELRNQPGALAHVCEVLAAEHINIDYTYCSSGGRNGRVFGIFKVANADKASRILGLAANSTGRRRLEPRPARNQRSYQKK